MVIADITGYSVYLRDSELAHAQQTLGALLELLVVETRPPLVLSKLEGDAVLSYGLDTGALRGQAFVETIESTYVAFRRALDQMVMNTTCRCNACANIVGLDLKFFIHHGEFAVISVASTSELQGHDVNVIHRLVKNTVTTTTGWRAYALYTQRAIDELGLTGLAGAMARHTEVYDDVGAVETWVQDLHPVWEEYRGRSVITIDPGDVLVEVSADVSLPPAVVWSFLIEPEHRKILMRSDRQEVIHDRNGRIAQGTVYECYHGKTVIPQMVLEWTPLERFVTRDRLPIPGGKTFVINECRLTDLGDGTRLTQSVARPTGPWWARSMARLVIVSTRKAFQRDLERFRDYMLEASAAASDVPG